MLGVNMEKHGLGSGKGLPTGLTGALVITVLLLEVSVQSLHEGCPNTTEMTDPGFEVLVVSVHVVHQPSEPPALFLTNLTDAELLVIIRYFLFGILAQISSLGFMI